MSPGRCPAPHPPGPAALRRRAATCAPRMALLVACALAAVPGVASAAAGPTGADGLAELRRAHDRLGVELAQLRRLVPEEGAAATRPDAAPPPPPWQAPRAEQAPSVQVPRPGQAAPGGDQPGLAGFEVRLGRMEEELRGLTGRIEQLEFEQRRVNERLERLVADLDVRFSAIEAGGGGGAGSAPSDGGREAAGSGPAPAAAGSPGALDRDLLDRVPPAGAGAAAGPSAAPPGQAPGTDDPIAQYHGAMDLLRAGDYATAEGALEAFVAAHPEHQLAANAAYWLAETRYVREDYSGAAASFARNFQTYGADAAKAPDNLLKLGMSLDALGDKEKACQVYQELTRTFPTAPTHIEQAVQRERSRAGCA